ncbi:MAG TPA: hypothetical protein VIZ69_06890, partial [Thermoanaerobaculia bacterium]
ARIAELTRRGAVERAALSTSVTEISGVVSRRKSQWKWAGALAGTVAAAGTIAYKLFGSASPAARIGKAASTASIGVGLLRAFLKLRKFL